MTSAKERAVEAGARALVAGATGSDTSWDNETEHWRECLRADAEAVLRAAFPILAEELVDDLWERALVFDKGIIEGHIDRIVAEELRDRASALRARIQQMAEAL